MMAHDGEQLGLATEVTVAWLSNPHTRVKADEASAMLASVHAAIGALSKPSAAADAAAPEHAPAVTSRQSLASPDYIVSMIDGTRHRTLKRHLRNHGLTPDEYRQRYGLKADYPMVARGYSAARSATAKQHGFGRKPSGEAAPEQESGAAPEPPATAAPDKRRRLDISGAKQAAQAHLSGDGGETAREP